MGFWLVIRPIEHLKIVIINNYNAVPDSRIQLLTTAHANSERQSVFTSGRSVEVCKISVTINLDTVIPTATLSLIAVIYWFCLS